MRYTFLLYSDENAMKDVTEEAMAQQLKVYGQYIGALKEAGVFVDTDWLSPTATATTLSMASGTRVIHDGPFAETKEQLGGYFVIEVPDLDAALVWAEKCPSAHFGKVEIRASAMPEGRNGA